MAPRASLVLVLLVAAPASGQVDPSQISFPKAKEATLRVLRGNFKAYALRTAVAGNSYIGSPRAGLTRADSVTAVSVANASIGTDVEGALAGITASPFLLFGLITPHQLKVTLATLEGEKLRVGLAYSHEDVWDPNTYRSLGFDNCDLSEGELEKKAREIDALEASFLQVCNSILRILPKENGPENAYLAARTACAGESLGKGNEPTLGELFVLRAEAALDAVEKDSRLKARTSETREEIKSALQNINELSLPRVDACHYDPNDPTDTAPVTKRYLATAFERPQFRYGVGTTFEFDAFRWGFSTKDNPVTSGEVLRIEAVPELSYKAGRLETYGSFGVGATRASGQEDLHLLLSPKFGISWLACFLTRTTSSDPAQILRTKGELPPHLVVGFSANVDLAPDRPITQPKLVEGVELTAYVDFRFSSDLAFRLGVPVKATLVKREATDTVTERSDLQWSVPVSILAVIKQ